MKSTRREFLERSAVLGGVASAAYLSATGAAAGEKSDNRRKIAAIGVGGSQAAYSQGWSIARKAARHGRMVAVCDVDVMHMAEFNAEFGNRLAMYTDYRQLLERERPDVVTIGTPDHWHVPIAVAALRTGCDVFCEKPLTLTIEEGFRIREAVEETGGVFQVGTQQRSEFDLLFLQAIAVVKSGRLGKNVRADLAIGGGPIDGPFPTVEPRPGLDWNMWVGPAQEADYSTERCKEFRWYYDYSGGKLTDWGAHHVDIAQWALGLDRTGPTKISGTAKFPPIVPENFNWQEYLEGKASLPNAYHTPAEFHIELQFADGTVIGVHDYYRSEDGRTHFPNGILFQGDEGRIYVNRGRLTGEPVEGLSDSEERELHDRVVELYRGKEPGDHMRDFFDCVASRQTPISDVETHHRAMTSCHLCNIALMLGRELAWDPEREQFISDEQATALMSRPRREPFSWAATT